MKTTVDGIEFRSRTEAAWYLVLQAYGMEPVYEPEAFEISTIWKQGHPEYRSCFYMPDFRLACGWMVEVKAGIDGESQDIAKACILGYRIPTLIIVGWPLRYRAVVINDRHKGTPSGFELLFRSDVRNQPAITDGNWAYLSTSYPDEHWLELDANDVANYFTPKHEPACGTLEGDIARKAWNRTKWNR